MSEAKTETKQGFICGGSGQLTMSTVACVLNQNGPLTREFSREISVTSFFGCQPK